VVPPVPSSQAVERLVAPVPKAASEGVGGPTTRAEAGGRVRTWHHC
jgi:hypothetical protein